jgi:mannose-1-phosphate guanylyltransferase
MRYAMIMAGGAGTRLWPMSRADKPKQLLEFIERKGGNGRRSLLELSASRLEGIVAPEHRYICTGEQYRAAIRAKLPAFTDERILGEPVGRDTVNAVGFAAAVFQKLDKNATFAVLTADHLIEPDSTFARCVDVGFKLVEEDPTRFVTFAIKPTYPATGFGYVECGEPIADGGARLSHVVERFVEKPDLHRATAYVESGHFYWNAGMFVFHASTFMDRLAKFKPESHAGLKKIQDAWGTPRQRAVIDEVYPSLPRISVDYAVMEPASKDPSVTIAMVKMDLDWLDVGSWPSYAETLAPDRSGNRVSGTSETIIHGGKNNLVVTDGPPGHTVALLGCENLIVVRTPDATLVMPRDKAQELKDLHAKVRPELR